MEDLIAGGRLAFLEDQLDPVRERAALALGQVIVEAEKILQPEGNVPAAAAAALLVAPEPPHRLRELHRRRQLRAHLLVARRRHHVERDLHCVSLPQIITQAGLASAAGERPREASRLAVEPTESRPRSLRPSSSAASWVAARIGSMPAST